MRHDVEDRDPTAAIEAVEAAPETRCESCGVERLPGDPILCRICGEPVLGDGWTP